MRFKNRPRMTFLVSEMSLTISIVKREASVSSPTLPILIGVTETIPLDAGDDGCSSADGQKCHDIACRLILWSKFGGYSAPLPQLILVARSARSIRSSFRLVYDDDDATSSSWLPRRSHSLRVAPPSYVRGTRHR